MAARIVELRNIKKSYGNVYALGGVTMHVEEGEVVGLIGDNGAGKSTLIKILSGVVRPTSGEIVVRGQPVKNWSSARAREAGIETVYQDRALAVQQSIVRNIFMGRELAGPFGWLKVNQQIEEAGRLMREIGFTSRVFTPRSIVGALSGGERQGVAIARAIYKQADVIVLDELLRLPRGLGRVVRVVERDVLDRAAVDTALGIDIGVVRLLGGRDGLVQRRRACERERAADHDLLLRHAGRACMRGSRRAGRHRCGEQNTEQRSQLLTVNSHGRPLRAVGWCS